MNTTYSKCKHKHACLINENQRVLFMHVKIAFAFISPIYTNNILIFQNHLKHISHRDEDPGQVAVGVLELTCSIIQHIYYESNHCEVIVGLTLSLN